MLLDEGAGQDDDFFLVVNPLHEGSLYKIKQFIKYDYNKDATGIVRG
jgi:hypothetical protein